MARNDQLYLNDILDAVERIKRFTEGVSLREFIEDELVQSAVIRQLEIIGEAANKVSKEVQTEFNNIPWEEIIGTRNKLIHDYSGVDIILVWNIVEEELDNLEEELKKIFETKGYKRLKEDRNKKIQEIIDKLQEKE